MWTVAGTSEYLLNWYVNGDDVIAWVKEQD